VVEKENILVLAYPGTGKTYTASNFENVMDFEQQFYTYVYDDNIKHLPLEQIKNSMTTKRPNPQWPTPFVKDLGEELPKNEIVIATFTPQVYEAVRDANYPNTKIILAVFDQNNFEELADRFRARGNTEEFVDRRRVDFPVANEIFDNAEGVDKIVIRSGKYLADALTEYGLELRPGEGKKNYL